MPIRVRRATSADAQLLADQGRDLNAYLGDPVEYFTCEAACRDGFGPEPQFSVLLAELDGEPAGYALFHDAYETSYAARGLYLGDLYVKPAVRGQGVGRALVAAVAREARSRGRTYLWWVSKPWNKDAQAFYRELGAIEEPVVAHALLGEAFETLAETSEQSEARPEPPV